MPVEKITAAQFRDQLRAGITDRTESHDVGFGPIRDIVIDPVATVLEQQNDRVRAVSLLLSLQNPANLSEVDVDGIVFNETIRRILGARSLTTLTFSTPTVDPSGPDLVVQRGFPVATTPDANTGETVTFTTTEARTLPAAQRASFFNITTQRYELQVPAQATVQGSVGRVGQGRIRRPLRPLVGFDQVTNTAASEGGLDRETNAELINRYLLAILGRDLTTPTGIEFFTRNNFPEVEDVLVVFGDDPLLTRSADDAGATDAYIIGEQLVARTENLEFLGVGQLLQVSFPPIAVVTQVSSGATTYAEGTDYEVVRDTGGNRGSTRAVEGVRFLSTVTSPPALGAAVTINYTQNNLIQTLQTTSEQRTNESLGRDLLYKEGIQVDIILEAQLRVATGFSTVTVPNAVSTAIQNFINSFGLGANVENSDIQGEVRRISGVDNFIITRLVRDPALTGTADIVIGGNEFARIATADLVITLI
jgi:uncharacterized phage protein gp47/JayE